MKLLILDLDKTLWSHPDITMTSPPYLRVSDDGITDSRGEAITLNPCAAKLLETAKSRGIILAVASWNDPEKAVRALEAFNLKDYFQIIVVEPHPEKDEMVRKILRELVIEAKEAVFVDDNPAMCELVSRTFPSLKVLNVGRGVKDLCELLELLEKSAI